MMPVSLNSMGREKRLNLIKAGLNLFWRRSVPWSRPIHMQIELTNYCELRCPVCPAGIKALKRKPESMNVHLFERLMNEVGPYLLTASLWAWGEPLLHPQLDKILAIAGKHNVATILSTNGQRLNDKKVVESILAHPPTHLVVAIDGLTDETNSKFRVGARLEPALEGVRILASEKLKRNLALPMLSLRFIVMKHNQGELYQIRDFAIKNMFDFFSIRTLSIIDWPDNDHRALVPDREKYRAYNYRDDKRITRKDFVCQHAFSFPTVFADGTVVACEQDYNAGHPYGVISEKVSFSDVWFGGQAAGTRRIIRDAPQNFSFCRNCPYADRPVSSCSVAIYDLRKNQ